MIEQVAVKRAHRRIILRRIRRALLEIDWKNREPIAMTLCLGWTAGETEQLKKLPAILLSETIVSEQWINEIVFVRFCGRIVRVREDRWDSPGVLCFLVLIIKKRTDRFCPCPCIQCQFEFMKQRTE